MEFQGAIGREFHSSLASGVVPALQDRGLCEGNRTFHRQDGFVAFFQAGRGPGVAQGDLGTDHVCFRNSAIFPACDQSWRWGHRHPHRSQVRRGRRSPPYNPAQGIGDHDPLRGSHHGAAQRRIVGFRPGTPILVVDSHLDSPRRGGGVCGQRRKGNLDLPQIAAPVQKSPGKVLRVVDLHHRLPGGVGREVVPQLETTQRPIRGVRRPQPRTALVGFVLAALLHQRSDLSPLWRWSLGQHGGGGGCSQEQNLRLV